MKTFVGVVLLALLPTVALAADGLDWAYPVAPKPEPLDNVVLKQMPGSDRQYTQAQIDDPFNAPDWYPGDHPAMPPIVANGAKPGVRACAMCHLPTGAGHPESSGLAGLPANYVIRQMADFKTGHRRGVRSGNMITFAAAISDEDVRAAAEYFASRPSDGLEIATIVEPRALGTGGAVLFAAQATTAVPLIIANGDSLVAADIAPARALLDQDDIDGAILGVRVADAGRFGSLTMDADGRLTGFAEKRPGTTW